MKKALVLFLAVAIWAGTACGYDMMTPVFPYGGITPRQTEVKIYSTPGTYTWTKPPWANTVYVVCIGGGGSGGFDSLWWRRGRWGWS